jgi:hypothetical protein
MVGNGIVVDVGLRCGISKIPSVNRIQVGGIKPNRIACTSTGIGKIGITGFGFLTKQTKNKDGQNTYQSSQMGKNVFHFEGFRLQMY